MNLINILFIHHAAGWGGAPKSMIELINVLDKKQYKIYVLLLKDSIVSERLRENNIEYSIAQSTFYKKYYHYFTHSEAGYVKWYQIYRFLKLSVLWLLSRYYFAGKELENFDYDIAHLNSSVLTDWLAPAKKKGKVIIHIREPFRNGKLDIIGPFFRHLIIKYADKIIAISRDNARRINIPSKTEVIYNIISVNNITPAKNSYSSKYFLYLGGDAYIKGFYTLVEALDHLDKDIMIYFGGSYMLPQINNMNFKQKIKFLFGWGKKKKKAIEKMQNHPHAIEIGMINNVDEIYNKVCCLISPFSVPHFSRPVIEAYAYKKPVIGSDIEGMKEIIKHGQTGLLFAVDNAAELAKMINYLTNKPKLIKIMGVNGYNFMRQNFNPNDIFQIHNIYRFLSDR